MAGLWPGGGPLARWWASGQVAVVDVVVVCFAVSDQVSHTATAHARHRASTSQARPHARNRACPGQSPGQRPCMSWPKAVHYREASASLRSASVKSRHPSESDANSASLLPPSAKWVARAVSVSHAASWQPTKHHTLSRRMHSACVNGSAPSGRCLQHSVFEGSVAFVCRPHVMRNATKPPLTWHSEIVTDPICSTSLIPCATGAARSAPATTTRGAASATAAGGSRAGAAAGASATAAGASATAATSVEDLARGPLMAVAADFLLANPQ